MQSFPAQVQRYRGVNALLLHSKPRSPLQTASNEPPSQATLVHLHSFACGGKVGGPGGLVGGPGGLVGGPGGLVGGPGGLVGGPGGLGGGGEGGPGRGGTPTVGAVTAVEAGLRTLVFTN